jgi:hypothetical protein
MGPPAYHADCVCLEKQMLDLAQLKNREEKMKYFNALMATVLGDEEERAAAIQYLKEVDPEIWDQEE